MRRQYPVLIILVLLLSGCSYLKSTLKSLSMSPDLQGVIVGELIRVGESLLVEIVQTWEGDRPRGEKRMMRIIDPKWQKWAMGNLAPGVSIEARGGGSGNEFVAQEIWEMKNRDGAAQVFAALQGHLDPVNQEVRRSAGSRPVQVFEPRVEVHEPMRWESCVEARELLDKLNHGDHKDLVAAVKKLLPECK